MKDNAFKIIKKITKESKNVESYDTGLVMEKIIVASYQSMPIEKLEKIRFIINKIIKKKKELKRFENVKNSNNTGNVLDVSNDDEQDL